ncbi:MAG: arginine--tRNA ligase [Candidatus Sungbacteria bacterium]|uniref:Arginine--tRNA ligase n=1 Tax=Candidatus Sungiibacteriota bacterium TaxID=2750080 RepID=A0A932VRZ0_9BACT|nr:arginine--tRNA ligase [Candidatus Sungbacteria bacterium]
MIREELRGVIRDAIREKFPGIEMPDFSIAAPKNPEHGDYAVNAAMAVAKSARMNPLEAAGEIKNAVPSHELIEKIEIVKPGFVNFFLSKRALKRALADVLARPDAWGRSDIGKGKTVMVEYFQLNIAKRPHIGHIRSAVIGDALKRMFLSQGYRAVSDTHVGDWGTQFGVLLLGYKEAGADLHTKGITEDPFAALEEIYLAENIRIQNDPDRRKRAKEEFAKLERGDAQNRAIWQWMVDVSMKNLEESAARLGLLPFDEHRGESFYEDMMQPIVALALEKKVAKKTEEGAVVVDLAHEGLDEAILIKSDGASTYLLRDLAAIIYRKERWNFWRNLYVVDVRQSHHFRQVFRVAQLLGFDGAGQNRHIEYGFMSLPTGAISTRQGNVISLESVVDEARKRAQKVIAEKNPDLENKEEIARMVGIGALKYFDLAHHRRSDIVFRWDEALSFEGNSGPYLQYTHARLKSILRKMGEDTKGGFENALPDPLEHRIMGAIMRFPEAIEDALLDFTPNTLAQYLYSLAKLANEFYHSHPVMQEEDRVKRYLRVALIRGVAVTLSRGLDALGIESPEEM